MQQRIRFSRSRDGVQLACATSGEGPPFVKVANWSSTAGSRCRATSRAAAGSPTACVKPRGYEQQQDFIDGIIIGGASVMHEGIKIGAATLSL